MKSRRHSFRRGTPRPVVVEIRPSTMLPGQVGLFAARPLRKGDIVVPASDFSEILVPLTVIRRADAITRRKIHAHCGHTPTACWLPRHRDLNRLSIQWYMHHSCNPNVGFDQRNNFVALRPLAAGEELVHDFGALHDNPRWRMNCNCGESTCRHIITGKDWQLPHMQDLYSLYAVSHLRKKIAELRKK